MRRLKREELKDGLYVALYTDYMHVGDITERGMGIYQLIEDNGKLYYTMPGSSWRQDATLVVDVWIETPETLRLNRERTLNSVFHG